MHYKELTSTDYMECRILNEKFIKNNLYVPQPIILNVFYFNDDEPLYKIFGCFDEYGVLCAAVFVRFSGYDRSMIISCIIKQSFTSIQTVVDTIGFALEYAKERNFCKVYVKYFNNHDKVLEKIISRKSSILGMYTAVTEDIIPANKRSSFEKYWYEMQACRIYPNPITIKMYSLKEEFRPKL